MEALGIDLKYLLIQIANIALFYFLFTRFLLKPILKIMDERKRKITEGIENAEKAKEELSKIEEMKVDLKKRAKGEEKKLLEEAKIEAQKQTDLAISEAKSKAAKIISEANIAAKNVEKEMIKKFEDNQLKIIDRLIEKVFSDKLNDVEIKARYQKIMSELH